MGIMFVVLEHPWRLGLDLLHPPSYGIPLVGCPRTIAPKIVPPSNVDKGLAHHLHHSCQTSPHCNHLPGECIDHALRSGYFLLLRQCLKGRRGVVAPPMEWYYGLHGPVVPLVGAAPIL